MTIDKIISRKKAFSIIDRFPQASVLVVGDLMLDRFIWGKVTRISPEAPVPVVDVQKEDIMLGGSANVLNNIWAMGGRAFGAGVIGSDDTGHKLLSLFSKRKIDTRGLVVEDKRPTTEKTRIVAHGQQVVRFDRESKKPIEEESRLKILSYIREIAHEVEVVVVSDYNKGVVDRPLIEGLREIFKNRGVIICVDPKSTDFSLYQGLDIITPNQLEAARAVGKEIADSDGLFLVGKTLLERYNFKAVLITRGEEGMSLFERAKEVIHTSLPTKAREVFDVTGAGDTVIGVFALCLAAGANFREAAVLANHAAGIVVGKIGTATVSPEELKNSL